MYPHVLVPTKSNVDHMLEACFANDEDTLLDFIDMKTVVNVETFKALLSKDTIPEIGIFELLAPELKLEDRMAIKKLMLDYIRAHQLDMKKYEEFFFNLLQPVVFASLHRSFTHSKMKSVKDDFVLKDKVAYVLLHRCLDVEIIASRIRIDVTSLSAELTRVVSVTLGSTWIQLEQDDIRKLALEIKRNGKNVTQENHFEFLSAILLKRLQGQYPDKVKVNSGQDHDHKESAAPAPTAATGTDVVASLQPGKKATVDVDEKGQDEPEKDRNTATMPQHKLNNSFALKLAEFKAKQEKLAALIVDIDNKFKSQSDAADYHKKLGIKNSIAGLKVRAGALTQIKPIAKNELPKINAEIDEAMQLANQIFTQLKAFKSTVPVKHSSLPKGGATVSQTRLGQDESLDAKSKAESVRVRQPYQSARQVPLSQLKALPPKAKDSHFGRSPYSLFTTKTDAPAAASVIAAQVFRGTHVGVQPQQEETVITDAGEGHFEFEFPSPISQPLSRRGSTDSDSPSDAALETEVVTNSLTGPRKGFSGKFQ